MSTLSPAPTFELSEQLGDRLLELCAELGLPHETVASAASALLVELVDAPQAVFETPPQYVRAYDREAVIGPDPRVSSRHSFFDVVKARASRRDFTTEELDANRLISILAWTFGQRGTEVAYDFRDAPLRYIPSAGGLASTDGYVVINNVEGIAPGSYYYDLGRGLVSLVSAHMSHKVASLLHDSDWVARAAAVVVCVVNTDRVARKYGRMAAKLGFLDAGVALGHLELVANALELRSTMLGGLPARETARLIGIDDENLVPVGALAIGTRGGGHGH